MKNSKILLSVLFCTMTIYSCIAQEIIKPENSMLWKIEHPAIQDTSYLYGTMHQVCYDFKIPKKVTQALDIVDALVLEIDLSDPKKQKSFEAAFKATETICDALTQDEFDQLDSLLLPLLGSSLINFDTLGLINLSHLVSEKLIPCRSFEIRSLEGELTETAKAHHKSIYSLETALELATAVKNAQPKRDHIFHEIMSIESMKAEAHEVYLAYKEEDLNYMTSPNGKQVDQNIINYLLVERNKKWMEKMPEMMKLRSNMFAVGAAHLPADYGLIHLLREKGYTVTPVHSKWYEQ